jgi:hypothetical protein
MRRREFIALFGGAAVSWPLSAHAQQPARLPQVAILREVAGDPKGLRNNAALVQGLKALGWTEGRINMGEQVIVKIKTFLDGYRPPDRVLPSIL